MEFDFQFISIGMIFVQLVNQNNFTKSIKLPKKASQTVLILTAVSSCYMGFVLGLSYKHQYELSYKLYPYNTENNLKIVESSSDFDKVYMTAKQINSQNTECYIPYSIFSKFAFENRDYENFIYYQNIVFEKNHFRYNDYLDYCQKLIFTINLNRVNSDDYSKALIKRCELELIATKNKLIENKEKLSTFGKMIYDQPKTTLPSDLLDYISKIELTNY